MTALIFVDLDKLRKYSRVFYAAGLVLLAAVFVPGLGVESYGAKRWLNLGITTVQPSEYAKFTTVFFWRTLWPKEICGKPKIFLRLWR